MEPYQERVVEELSELTKKHEKLELFIASEKFKDLDVPQQALLRRQRVLMRSYMSVLTERIELFTQGQSK
jgi:hypothetical protein